MSVLIEENSWQEMVNKASDRWMTPNAGNPDSYYYMESVQKGVSNYMLQIAAGMIISKLSIKRVVDITTPKLGSDPTQFNDQYRRYLKELYFLNVEYEPFIDWINEINDLNDMLNRFFEERGYVYAYGSVWRRNSAVYQAITGNIPLTSELFHEAIRLQDLNKQEYVAGSLQGPVSDSNLTKLCKVVSKRGSKPWNYANLSQAIEKSLDTHIETIPEDYQRYSRQCGAFNYLFYRRVTNSDFYLDYDLIAAYKILGTQTLRHIAINSYKLPSDIVNNRSRDDLCQLLKDNGRRMTRIEDQQDQVLAGKVWTDIISGKDSQVTWIPNQIGILKLYIDNIPIDHERIPNSYQWLKYGLKSGSYEYLVHLIQRVLWFSPWSPDLWDAIPDREKARNYLMRQLTQHGS